MGFFETEVVTTTYWRFEGLIFGKIQRSKLDCFAKGFSSVYYGGKILVAKILSSVLFSPKELIKA